MGSKMRMSNPSGLSSLLKDGYKHMSGVFFFRAASAVCAARRVSLHPPRALPAAPPAARRAGRGHHAQHRGVQAGALIRAARGGLARARAVPRAQGRTSTLLVLLWLPAAQLAAITRTSLGPNAMRKLVINHLEKLFVTSDAATIVQELEVAHPAARMLVRGRHPTLGQRLHPPARAAHEHCATSTPAVSTHGTHARTHARTCANGG